jgi:hypothetical protein
LQHRLVHDQPRLAGRRKVEESSLADIEPDGSVDIRNPLLLVLLLRLLRLGDALRVDDLARRARGSILVGVVLDVQQLRRQVEWRQQLLR